MKLGILGGQSLCVICEFNHKLLRSDGKNEFKLSTVKSKKDSCHIQSLQENFYFMNGYLTRVWNIFTLGNVYMLANVHTKRPNRHQILECKMTI
jgi:hypothetical protein